MNHTRILQEAQVLASKFSFWMVSGNITHLYGYAYELSDIKYDLEIKFNDKFPNSPPIFVYHSNINNLLGDFQLITLKNWTVNSGIIDIVQELKEKIQQKLNKLERLQNPPLESENLLKETQKRENIRYKEAEKAKSENLDEEGYITPDLEAYPSDIDNNNSIHDDELNLNNKLYYNKQQNLSSRETSESIHSQYSKKNFQKSVEDSNISEISTSINPDINTELSLIQQFFAFDQNGINLADINVYLTLTITKTFIININFTNFPEKPKISFPEELYNLLRDPNNSLSTINKWNSKKPAHIIDILHEIENKLFFFKEIETELNKILSEYQCHIDEKDSTKLHINLITYGFKEYVLDVDLKSFPKLPQIYMTPELQNIINIPITSLNSYKNWKDGSSEIIEIIREISWLLDKNSRINFEIDLLKQQYKELMYDTQTKTLKVKMKGKMKTQDITFDFQIKIPDDYPMKMPMITILNEFELETQQKIKNDLQASFKDFFEVWTPFTYIIDLFNSISKKIFEISVLACVICHKIECPTCSFKIADPIESCHITCPNCERTYHKHCWEQTIKNFGKCGFCLKIPPPEMF